MFLFFFFVFPFSPLISLRLHRKYLLNICMPVVQKQNDIFLVAATLRSPFGDMITEKIKLKNKKEKNEWQFGRRKWKKNPKKNTNGPATAFRRGARLLRLNDANKNTRNIPFRRRTTINRRRYKQLRRKKKYLATCLRLGHVPRANDDSRLGGECVLF